MKILQKGVVLLLGVLLVTIVGLIVAVYLTKSRNARAKALQICCRNNLVEIGKAARMYLGTNGEIMPNLQAASTQAGFSEMFVCPSTGHHPGDLSDVSEWTDYIFVEGLTTTSPPNTVMAFCPPRNHGGAGGNILSLDGCVHWVDADHFWRELGESGPVGEIGVRVPGKGQR